LAVVRPEATHRRDASLKGKGDKAVTEELALQGFLIMVANKAKDIQMALFHISEWRDVVNDVAGEVIS
jgi:hypothetical protein